MGIKEIDMKSLNISRARSHNHAIFFVTRRSLYGRYIYGKKNLVKASRLYESICYEMAGDWPNKNRNFTVQN